MGLKDILEALFDLVTKAGGGLAEFGPSEQMKAKPCGFLAVSHLEHTIHTHRDSLVLELVLLSLAALESHVWGTSGEPKASTRC